ncbi:hypothetical protein ABK040_005816 [Willaertia magna]
MGNVTPGLRSKRDNKEEEIIIIGNQKVKSTNNEGKEEEKDENKEEIIEELFPSNTNNTSSNKKDSDSNNNNSSGTSYSTSSCEINSPRRQNNGKRKLSNAPLPKLTTKEKTKGEVRISQSLPITSSSNTTSLSNVVDKSSMFRRSTMEDDLFENFTNPIISIATSSTSIEGFKGPSSSSYNDESIVWLKQTITQLSGQDLNTLILDEDN